MMRLVRLDGLRWEALFHMMAAEPGTAARQIRAARQSRLNAAWRAERERVELARLRRVAAYQKRSGRAA
ncbi:MAG: hypothetical protein Q4C89_00755 [Deinococcus sp.]|uniref:hypothetical protein n=1 Tax=Deinococcus sp. TaxID=47478 RepID=UPI0026DB59E9|nr:hypothetical protein [Deinococcus sp.]MDO4244538.1 hypothetical protein [Deinococcus sp.]